MTVTGVDLNRDGIPDVLQQPQVGFGASVQFGAPVHTRRGCLLYHGDVVPKVVKVAVAMFNQEQLLVARFGNAVCQPAPLMNA